MNACHHHKEPLIPGLSAHTKDNHLTADQYLAFMTADNGHTQLITPEPSPPITDNLEQPFQDLYNTENTTYSESESSFPSSTNSETNTFNSIGSDSDNSTFSTASSRHLHPCLPINFNGPSLPEDRATNKYQH